MSCNCYKNKKSCYGGAKGYNYAVNNRNSNSGCSANNGNGSFSNGSNNGNGSFNNGGNSGNGSFNNDPSNTRDQYFKADYYYNNENNVSQVNNHYARNNHHTTTNHYYVKDNYYVNDFHYRKDVYHYDRAINQKSYDCGTQTIVDPSSEYSRPLPAHLDCNNNRYEEVSECDFHNSFKCRECDCK